MTNRIAGKKELEMRAKFIVIAVGAALLLAPGFASAVIDPAAKCQATKLKLSAKYASCRLIEESKAYKAGTAPDYTNCETRLSEGWAKVEAAYPTECPTLGDLGLVEDTLIQCLPAAVYTVRIFMDPVEPVSSINYLLNYAESYGELEGSETSVSCVNQVPDAVHFFFDVDADREMGVYFSHSTTEFSIPVELARCTFIASSLIATDESDFTIGSDQAVNLAGNNVAVPNMYVVVENAN
jgi:hypothetical protein